MAMMELQDLVEDIKCHARGMWRFRWLTICVAWGAALAGWLVVLHMPNIYKSSASVFVDTNSLLPELTEGLSARENLMDEVELVSKDLLSRPNLVAVARGIANGTRRRDVVDLAMVDAQGLELFSGVVVEMLSPVSEIRPPS